MTKEELGGFAVRLFRDGDDYCAKADYEFHDAPNMAIVYGITALILRLSELGPEFMNMLKKVMTAYLDVLEEEDGE